MSETAEKLKPVLAALSPEDRDELMGYLASLDDEEGELSTQEEWEAAWVDEINRRVEAVRSGKVKCVPLEEVLRQVDERLGRMQ